MKTINNKKISVFHLNKFHWSLILINFLGCILYMIIYFVCLKPANGSNEWDVFVFHIAPIISVGATITNLLCVILLANKRIQNFYFGIIAVILFALISVITKNWLMVVLNGGYYLTFNILGIFKWKNNMDEKAEVRQKQMKTKKMFITVISAAILSGVAVSFIFAIPVIKEAMGDKEKDGWAYWIKLILNGTSLMLCIFAMQLALHAYKEQWTLWLIANFSVLFLWLINIVEFAESNDSLSLATSIFTLFTYALTTINSIFGYISWKKK